MRVQRLRAGLLVFAAACGSPSSNEGMGKGEDSSVLLAPPTSSPDDLAAQSVCINELMASNSAALVLDDGTSPDWLELHNPSDRDLPLEGWSLVDESTGTAASLDALRVFPAGGFLVLYADGSSEGTDRLPFTLERDGGSIFLLRPDGGGDRIRYGAQQTDVSVFRSPDCCASIEPDCFQTRFGGSPGRANDAAPQ